MTTAKIGDLKPGDRFWYKGVRVTRLAPPQDDAEFEPAGGGVAPCVIYNQYLPLPLDLEVMVLRPIWP